MRGQVSVEYMVLVGIAIGLLIPAVLFFLSYSKAKEAESVGAQVNNIGLEMVSIAKSTYSLGQGARRTLEVVMPEEVYNITVQGEEIVIHYETPTGRSEAVFFSTVPIITDNTTLGGQLSVAHPGITRYQFNALANSVNLTEVYT